MTSSRARRSRVLRVAALLAVLSMVVFAACDSTSKSSGTSKLQQTTTTTKAAAVVNCGNPVASYAPTGPLPPPGDMPKIPDLFAEICAPG